MGEWVLFDYGGVLCTGPVPADRRVLLTAAGLDPDDAAGEERFWTAFWLHREPYDRGAVEPAEVTFVDDRPANVAGAQAVGMRALLFTDPATLAADLDLRGDA